jgi:uncharacterized membrane protein YfcA
MIPLGPFLIPIGIGLCAGVASGLFGIGGGIIIVPLVLFFYPFSQQGATATSLIALLMPVGILGVWQYYSKGLVGLEHLKIGAWIALGIFVGALFGAKIATSISSLVLTRLFAIFLILVAIRLWWTAA